MSKKDLTLEAAFATGALIGLGLSFTALSPLVIGGIISFSSIATFSILETRSSDAVAHESEKGLILLGHGVIDASIATAAGVALGAAINPGIMSNTWTAALAGAAIGMVGIVSASLAETHIVGPVVEKVAKCFSKEAHI